MAFILDALYVMVAGIIVPAELRNSNVELLTVEEFNVSVNTAFTVELTATPVAPLAGDVDITVGALSSGANDAPNKTSTK